MIKNFNKVDFYKIVFINSLFGEISCGGVRTSFKGKLNIIDCIFFFALIDVHCSDLIKILAKNDRRHVFYLYKKLTIFADKFVFIKYFLNISNRFKSNFFSCILKLNTLTLECDRDYFLIDVFKLIIFVLFIRKIEC
ncbi:MAG TPA: hypothetical protein V7792_00930 [Candidatus Azoamicus sp. OHIO2]